MKVKFIEVSPGVQVLHAWDGTEWIRVCGKQTVDVGLFYAPYIPVCCAPPGVLKQIKHVQYDNAMKAIKEY